MDAIRDVADLVARDSEESAPAEYPPEQPEADKLEDDEEVYGAEEAEMQAALEQELEDTEAKAIVNGDDHEMEGAEVEQTKVKEDEENDVSEAGSEDLEAESSESEDDEEEEEGDGDEDMEMADSEDKPATESSADGQGGKSMQAPGQAEVMVH